MSASELASLPSPRVSPTLVKMLAMQAREQVAVRESEQASLQAMQDLATTIGENSEATLKRLAAQDRRIDLFELKAEEMTLITKAGCEAMAELAHDVQDAINFRNIPKKEKHDELDALKKELAIEKAKTTALALRLMKPPEKVLDSLKIKNLIENIEYYEKRYGTNPSEDVIRKWLSKLEFYIFRCCEDIFIPIEDRQIDESVIQYCKAAAGISKKEVKILQNLPIILALLKHYIILRAKLPTYDPAGFMKNKVLSLLNCDVFAKTFLKRLVDHYYEVAGQVPKHKDSFLDACKAELLRKAGEDYAILTPLQALHEQLKIKLRQAFGQWKKEHIDYSLEKAQQENIDPGKRFQDKLGKHYRPINPWTEENSPMPVLSSLHEIDIMLEKGNFPIRNPFFTIFEESIQSDRFVYPLQLVPEIFLKIFTYLPKDIQRACTLGTIIPHFGIKPDFINGRFPYRKALFSKDNSHIGHSIKHLSSSGYLDLLQTIWYIHLQFQDPLNPTNFIDVGRWKWEVDIKHIEADKWKIISTNTSAPTLVPSVWYLLLQEGKLASEDKVIFEPHPSLNLYSLTGLLKDKNTDQITQSRRAFHDWLFNDDFSSPIKEEIKQLIDEFDKELQKIFRLFAILGAPQSKLKALKEAMNIHFDLLDTSRSFMSFSMEPLKALFNEIDEWKPGKTLLQELNNTSTNTEEAKLFRKTIENLKRECSHIINISKALGMQGHIAIELSNQLSKAFEIESIGVGSHDESTIAFPSDRWEGSLDEDSPEKLILLLQKG